VRTQNSVSGRSAGCAVFISEFYELDKDPTQLYSGGASERRTDIAIIGSAGV
jgi:hypothetical protein